MGTQFVIQSSVLTFGEKMDIGIIQKAEIYHSSGDHSMILRGKGLLVLLPNVEVVLYNLCMIITKVF